MGYSGGESPRIGIAQNIAANTTIIEIIFFTIMINFLVFGFKVIMTYRIGVKNVHFSPYKKPILIKPND